MQIGDGEWGWKLGWGWRLGMDIGNKKIGNGDLGLKWGLKMRVENGGEIRGEE